MKSTTVVKFVTTLTSGDVSSISAGESTCVRRVGVQNPRTGVPVVIEATPILSVQGWIDAGLYDHSDHEFVHRIISGTRDGVNIGYDGPRISREFDNTTNLYYSHYRKTSQWRGKSDHFRSHHLRT